MWPCPVSNLTVVVWSKSQYLSSKNEKQYEHQSLQYSLWEIPVSIFKYLFQPSHLVALSESLTDISIYWFSPFNCAV